MIVLYTILVIIISITIIYVVGNLKFNDNIKKKILTFFSIIYNGFFGYIDTIFFILLFEYFTNRPKGINYEVPSSEIGFNAMLGIIILLIYISLLLPINLYMKKKSKINTKIYLISSIISTIIGIAIFWIFLDKKQQLL